MHCPLFIAIDGEVVDLLFNGVMPYLCGCVEPVGDKPEEIPP